MTQNELLEIAKRVRSGFKPETKSVGLEELERAAYEKLQQGEDVMGAMIDFIKVSIFNPEYGSNWSAKNDNELLGVKGLSQEDLEAVVAKYV